MKRKKVLIDVFFMHVAQTGIKTYIECLCDEIEKEQHHGLEYIISPDMATIRNSRFFKGKTSKWRNLLFQFFYLARKSIVLPVLSFWHNSDIVFSPDILSPVWCKGKKISVIHDTFFWENPLHYNPLWLKVYLKLLRWSLLKNAHVVTISNFSKQQLEKHLQIPHLPVHVVYPSTNIKAKKENQISVSPVTDAYFLHVGVMEKRKNLPVLIRAFSELLKKPDHAAYKLVLVGQRGPRETLDDYDRIVAQIQSLDLEGKVILPGYVTADEMDSYYQHAFAYVFPSLNEGFGMPVLEAFSYGLPVIISNQGALVEVGGEAVFKVKDNSPDSFKAAMQMLIEKEDLRNELKGLGLIRLKKFSGEKFFLSLQDCFNKIIHG